MNIKDSRVITPKLTDKLRQEFRLDWHGIHGAPHWARVRRNGLLLAKRTGADTRVVELFAFLHDSQRINDGRDGDHGQRAADSIDDLVGEYFTITDTQLQQLKFACAYHTYEKPTDNITVLTCWDSDRLDLGRVGIKPDPSRLFTEAARNEQCIVSAYNKSIEWVNKYSIRRANLKRL